jgi:hypothetical protein
MGFGDRMEEEIERKSDGWEDLWGSWEGRKGEIWVKTTDRSLQSMDDEERSVRGNT